jgi:hypothetical protein
MNDASSTSNLQPQRLSIRQRMITVVGLVAVLTLIKLIWVFSFEMNGEKLLNGKATSDLMERRKYLLGETTDIKHIRAAVPSLDKSLLRSALSLLWCFMAKDEFMGEKQAFETFDYSSRRESYAQKSCSRLTRDG